MTGSHARCVSPGAFLIGRRAALAAVLFIASAVGSAGAGQPQTADPLPAGTPRGEIVPRMACAADPTQTYSLYLPSDYTNARRWPVLLVFDPRRGGARAAEIFRPAAARFGWIVMSSNDTISDGPGEPNERALRALWAEATLRVGGDPERLYAAGFSGLAPAAISLGVVTGHIAGVIAVGGRFPPVLRERPVPFPIYGAAGTADFNFLEMTALEERQARTNRPGRFETFDAGHEWLPPSLAEQALWWFEIIAMREGRRPRDASEVLAWRTAELAGADAMEAEGRLLDAVRRIGVVVSTLDGLDDVERLRARKATIERRPELARERRDRARWDAWSESQLARLGPRLREIAGHDSVPIVARAEDQLGLPALASQARASTYAGASARRVQSWLFAQLSFYLWRDLMAARSYARAAFLQQVALRIEDAPVAWFRLGLARAAAGDRQRALESLEAAVVRGFASAAAFDEGDLASLRGDEAFERLRARVAAAVRDVSPK